MVNDKCKLCVNGHRSAISAYHNFVDNLPIGKHPKDSALMTGVCNSNSPDIYLCGI